MGFLSWLLGLFGKGRTSDGPGWVPDCPDVRDELFHGDSVHNGYADLRDVLPPVVDQESIGTCVPCSVAALLSCHLKKKDVRIPPQAFSALFLYYEGRAKESDTDVDSGMQIRTALKVAKGQGACLEDRWPYSPRRWAWRPSRAAYEDAQKNKKRLNIGKYRRLYWTSDVKSALDEMCPVAMGMTLYEKAWEQASSGYMPLPSDDDKPIGGHAVVIVGYNNEKQTFVCRNSMGPEWGDKGHFEIDQDLLRIAGVVSDLWMIK